MLGIFTGGKAFLVVLHVGVWNATTVADTHRTITPVPVASVGYDCSGLGILATLPKCAVQFGVPCCSSRSVLHRVLLWKGLALYYFLA